MAQYDFTFIDKKLSKTDLPHVGAFYETFDEDIDNLINNIRSNGFKLHIRTMHKGNSAQAMITDTGNRSEYKRRGLVAYSASPVEAILLCWYKHVVVFNHGKWTEGDDDAIAWG